MLKHSNPCLTYSAPSKPGLDNAAFSAPVRGGRKPRTRCPPTGPPASASNAVASVSFAVVSVHPGRRAQGEGPAHPRGAAANR